MDITDFTDIICGLDFMALNNILNAPNILHFLIKIFGMVEAEASLLFGV